ncbi:flagellar biosynthetic protein FliO [Kaistia dalseonensis]|uniref:Flagellar biosynthesis protein FliO n=1 Tax=Kaistia dalseonensis TaxID=410840 RepID=A0ABU0HBI7_9HYPH|nr:flagellar biosynthetic protein FliO [Kaistia dalseonensis]MCX5497046.1 flagellar biosynthetic protein FliO [Kaistia dalseonensis]MDQ0439672.1 hypothetical protein [Kaistia dalseonensis]
MRDYFEPMLGATGALIAQFAITLLIVLVLVFIVFWLIRRFTGGRFGNTATRGRQPRLSVLDALPIDPHRRLLLIRRDNVEHLILVGGTSDLVIEAAIHRSAPGQRRLDTSAGRGPAPQVNSRPAAEGAAPRAAEPQRAPEPARMAEPQRAPLAEPSRSELPQNEVLRAEPLPVIEPQAEVERPAEETSYRRDEPLREAAPEFVAAPPPPAFEPPPVPAEPPMRAAPQPPRAPVQPQVKSGRGLPSFLSGGRSRQTPTVPPEPTPADSRRLAGRVRPNEPQSRVTSPFATPPEPIVTREASIEPAGPAPAPEFSAPVRPPIPPAPAPTRMTGEEPFGTPDTEISRPLRFEPVFDTVSDEVRTEERAPAVEPPTASDQPVNIDTAFSEEAPILGHRGAEGDEEGAAAARATAVGDLEKEMARLLGEISGGRKK